MRATTITLTIPQSHLRDAAMRANGIDPKAIGMRPGTRVERNRKAMASRGYAKHKGKVFM